MNPGIEPTSKDHGSDCESLTFTTRPGSFPNVLKADLERHGFEPWTEIEAEIWRGAKETLEKEDLEREKENLLPWFPKMDEK